MSRNPFQTKSADVKHLPEPAALNQVEVQAIANSLFSNAITWQEDGSGLMVCPGVTEHTTPNQRRDCWIKLGDGRPPTISCFHSSCKERVQQANEQLRSQIAKAAWNGPKPRYANPMSGLMPVPLPTEEIRDSTVAFLESLFAPNEFVAIYDCRNTDQKKTSDGRVKYSPGAGLTRKVSDLLNAIKMEGGLTAVYPNGCSLFIRANPMEENGRRDREVTSFRYVLVDIDKDESGEPYPLQTQYGALIASKLPLASITYSGDISLATLVRVDAKNEAEYRARRDEVYSRMWQFIKIDESCGNPSRWTRFPGGTRHLCDGAGRDVHKEQRLYALNQGTSCWSDYCAALEAEKSDRGLIKSPSSNSSIPDRSGVVSALKSDFDEHAQYGINYNGNKPVVNLAVVRRVLKSHPEWAGKISYDGFLNRIFTIRRGNHPVEWADIHDSEALIWLQETFGLPNANIDDVKRAIPLIAHENETNCLQGWLRALEWDEQPRLASLLSTGFGAAPSEYHSSVGTCWLISMVARAMNPGCKVDTIPVFEGDQGAGKSSGLRILGGDLFTECHEQITSKDFYSVLSGRWLVEISEMHSFKRAEAERIKGIISNQSDRYRLPYDKHATDHPRQCVFAGTTNRDDWHNDDTGGRRFWPIECGRVNLDWLEANRSQLFAEAVTRYQNNEPWWKIPEAEQREKIEERRPEDPWTVTLIRYLENRDTVAINDVLRDCLDKPTDQHTPGDARRVAAILKDQGYERYSECIGKSKKRKWRRKP